MDPTSSVFPNPKSRDPYARVRVDLSSWIRNSSSTRCCCCCCWTCKVLWRKFLFRFLFIQSRSRSLTNVLKMGHSRPLFLYFCLFYNQLAVNNCPIKVADDWIRTRVLWYLKRPCCPLCHNEGFFEDWSRNWGPFWALVAFKWQAWSYSDDPTIRVFIL